MILLVLPPAAHAGLLGTVSQTFDVGRSPHVPHMATAWMTYNDPQNLFDDVILTAASAGLILTATAIDPDYNTVVATLTNGLSEQLFFGMSMGGGSSSFSWDEKNWFSLSTTDFVGANITSITLTVDEISFEDVDIWTNIHLVYTVRVYGESSLAVKPTTWGAVKALYR
jgi:hypothetical protein